MTRPRSQSKLGPPDFALHTRRSSDSRKERPRGARTWWTGGGTRLPSAAPGHLGRGASQPPARGVRGSLPPRQISGNARQAGIPQPPPGAASTHPPSWGSGRLPPRRAPPAGQVLRGPPSGVRARAPRVRRRREAGRSGPRGAEEGAVSQPSSTWVAGLRAAGAPAPLPGAAPGSERLPAPGHAGADRGLAGPGPCLRPALRLPAGGRRISAATSLVELGARRPPRRPGGPSLAPRPRDAHLPAPCGSGSRLPFPRPPPLGAPCPQLLPREAPSPPCPPPARGRLGPLPIPDAWPRAPSPRLPPSQQPQLHG